MQKVLAGAAAGALAAAPMAVAMKALQQTSPSARRRALPPRQITMALARRVGLASRLDGHASNAATTAAHFGYGSAVGALYPYAKRVLPGPTVMKGALFGAGLWAGSYLGWLPATGVMRSASRESTGRNAMMILAHVVWGVGTAVAVERLLARRARSEGADGADGFAREQRADGPGSDGDAREELDDSRRGSDV